MKLPAKKICKFPKPSYKAFAEPWEIVNRINMHFQKGTISKNKEKRSFRKVKSTKLSNYSPINSSKFGDHEKNCCGYLG